MKKLFLSVVALMCATLMFAQDNKTDVTQSGVDNDSDVLQVGVQNDAIVKQYGDLNISNIETKGDLNDAFVDQDGNENIAEIVQGIGNAETNLAETHQIGVGNKSAKSREMTTMKRVFFN